MSIRLIVEPVYLAVCDGIVDGRPCPARFLPSNKRHQSSSYSVREAALRAGWLMRPMRGRGSRSAPDLCPECKPTGGGG